MGPRIHKIGTMDPAGVARGSRMGGRRPALLISATDALTIAKGISGAKELQNSLLINLARLTRFVATCGRPEYAKDLCAVRRKTSAQIAGIREELVSAKPFHQIREDLSRLADIEILQIQDMRRIIETVKGESQKSRKVPAGLHDILAPMNIAMHPFKYIASAKNMLEKSIGENLVRLKRFLGNYGTERYKPEYGKELNAKRIEILSLIARIRSILVRDMAWSEDTYPGLLGLCDREAELINQAKKIFDIIKSSGRAGEAVPAELRGILAPEHIKVKLPEVSR
jgi:hypothetical protein